MTRSSARRQNRNARMIVALVPARDAAHRYSTEGAFTASDARRWVRHASPYLWPDPPAETNWEFCAELLNRKVRRFLVKEMLLVAEISYAAPNFNFSDLLQETTTEATMRMLYARSVVKAPTFIKTWSDS